jgi:plastocyanin
MRLRKFISRSFAVGAVFLSATVIASAEDTVTFELAIKDHKFEPAEIKVPAGKPIVLKVRNLDETPEEFESAALRVEKIIVAQGQIIVKLKPLAAGQYPFVGDYHDSTAKGVLIVE